MTGWNDDRARPVWDSGATPMDETPMDPRSMQAVPSPDVAHLRQASTEAGSVAFAQKYFNDLPLDMEAMIVQDMEDLGMDRALIYAFQHTGMLVTDDTLDFYADDQLVVWQSAVDRYRRLPA